MTTNKRDKSVEAKLRPAIAVGVVLLALITGAAIAADQSDEPFKFFREYVGLNEDQISAIRNGKAVAKIIDSPMPEEVFVFGAVYVESAPEKYVKLASDIDALRKLPNYLAIHKFSDPPRLSDLDGFSLDEEDIKQLKNCEPGQCEIQLPADKMEEFQRSVNWSAPDVADQVNHLAQKMTLDLVLNYQQAGNTALGTYWDKSRPTVVTETFQSTLSRSKGLPVYLPELHSYLLDYPKTKPGNIKTEFYWEKVNFGLKPTIRVLQAVLYSGTSPKDPAYAVAVKQLYASHYFETALDLTVCAPDGEHPNRPGFYLITLKGSQQAGLTGLKGRIVRKVAVDKTRSSLEKTLTAIKQKLETQAN
jgi:hypothetical protein